MKYNSICEYLIIVLLLLSCSASQFGWQEGPVTGENESSGYIEDFDPLTLNDDDIVIEPVDRTEPSQNPSRSELETPSSPLPGNEEEMIQGYRVQLLISRDEELATEAKKRAIFQFPEVDVYMVFETPYYKIRIGDCLTEKEAEQLMNEAIRKGYDDAWRVQSKIYRKSGSSSDF
ncbi:SPOR domain-containing protein [bacterium]|nr:SPOR domain-containing protein [bacterium]RQV94354.1 MAG: SPOR domain-containing protein [bacterium]